jgi:hypothetical protein
MPYSWGILKRLARQELVTSFLLFAEDVVIFCHAGATELRAVHEILGLFGHASGLRTNFVECSVSLIVC